MISLDTLRLLNELLTSASVNVGSDDFEETSKRLSKAKRELGKELARAEKVEPKTPKPSSTRKRAKRK